MFQLLGIQLLETTKKNMKMLWDFQNMSVLYVCSPPPPHGSRIEPRPGSAATFLMGAHHDIVIFGPSYDLDFREGPLIC